MKKLITLTYIMLIGIYSLFSQPCVNCDPNSNASGTYSTALGFTSNSLGFASFSSGSQTYASGIASMSLGFKNFSYADYSTTIGSYLRITNTGTESVIIGSGANSSYYLENNQTACLLVGFRSSKPTLFVGTSPDWNSTGRVGIGNITNPSAKLHILADEGDTAAVFIQPHNWANNEYAILMLGTQNK